MVIWVTGLSGSGKTTLCTKLRDLLKSTIPELVLLDGDQVRQAFGEGLGYREEDRIVQIKRIQNLALMLSNQGMVVLVAALYANPELLAWNRENLTGYFEIYLEASLEALKLRDYKGLYQGASSGTIPNVVGMDIPWHSPQSPDLTVNTDELPDPEITAQRLIAAIPRLSR